MPEISSEISPEIHAEIRIGVVFRPPSPPEALRAAVTAAEAAGIDELWLWEDCFAEGGLTTSTAALAWTERISVGIGLLPVPLRNPAVAAMEIATLARLFPGRFVPAVGHGVLDWMGQVGARAESPMTLLREHTVAIGRLLHGERVTVDGRYVRLDGVELEMPPEIVPPLLVGARGQRTIDLAGELSDGVLLDDSMDVTVDDGASVRAAVERVAAAAAAAGRPAPQVVAFAEVDPQAPDLDERVATVIAGHIAAGTTSAVLQGTGAAPDPAPLIAAVARHLS